MEYNSKLSDMRTSPKEIYVCIIMKYVKVDKLWKWKICQLTPLWRKSIIVVGYFIHLQWKEFKIYSSLSEFIDHGMLLEKEKWKYCSMEKFVPYGIFDNGISLILIIHWKLEENLFIW